MASAERRIDRLLERTGTARSRDFVAKGVARSQLSRLVASGKLVRLASGLYAAPGHENSEHATLSAIAKRTPGVVFCLLTALRFHGLTTQAPFEVWIAIGNKAHPPRLDHPPLRTVRFSAESLAVGVEKHLVDGTPIRVTSVARPSRTASSSETRSDSMSRSKRFARLGARARRVPKSFGDTQRSTASRT